MPRYRVNFQHVRTRVLFEVELAYAPSAASAEEAAAKALTQHLRLTAGRIVDWCHAATVTETS